MMHPEVTFTAVYSVFLAIVAVLLRRGARRIASSPEATIHEASGKSTVEPSWSHGLASRFRLGLAGTVLGIAIFILVAALRQFHSLPEALVLVSVLLAVAILGCLLFWS